MRTKAFFFKLFFFFYKLRKDFFLVFPMQYLPAVAYQQANQLSHWPSALWHSLVHRMTVMEGWACPGVRCSHRKIHGSQLVGGQINVYQRESTLVCSALGKLLPAAPSHTHTKNLIPSFFSCRYSVPVTLDIGGESRIIEWLGWVMSWSSGKHSRHYGPNVLSALKWERISC